MSSRISIDSQLIPFTLSNDPLPDELKPLLDEQLEMCDGHLDDAQRTILEVEDNIRALEETLHRLKEKRHDYQQRIEEFRDTKASLHSCASVVRRVPAEIIAEIMQLAVNNGASDSFGGERTVFLVLRCVSKLWRRTAFSTPSLWKHVSLALSEFSGDREDAKSRLFSALNNWFSCAGEKADLNLVVSGINTTTLGVDDMFEWLQKSHFNISHLVLFELVPSVGALQSLCIAQPESLSETTALVLSTPQRSLSDPDSAADMSLAFPKLKILGLESTSDFLGFWRPSLLLVHQTLAHLELTQWTLSATDVATIC